MQFSFSSKVQFVLDIEKSIDQKPALKGGVEYKVLRPLSLRIGCRHQFTKEIGPAFPVLCSGFGLISKNFSLDVANTWHPVLGISPSLTFSYVFK
jgi:hypothetical protein